MGKINNSLTVLILGVVLFLPVLRGSPIKVLGVESCTEDSCSCPTSTPTGTCIPTPTLVSPSPTTTVSQPTPTSVLPSFSPTPTPPLPTATPKLQEGVGGLPDDDGGLGPASAPVCTDAVPPKPYLRDLKLLGNGKVSLFWDFVDPATHYSIGYGPLSGNYLYGVDNTGKINSFIIGELGTGNYCFSVKGVNNCMPGEFSNERCIVSSSNKVLGASVLGATGSFNDDILNILFIMGSICSSVAVRLLFANKKLG